MPTRSKSADTNGIVSVMLLLAFASGAAALSHQLLWTRRLIDLLGASHESAARVFGCFFLGLTIGAILAAWLLPRVQRLWRGLAIAEAAVALLSLPAMALPVWTNRIWQVIGLDGLMSWQGSLIKLVASLIVILPPAVAMGATLPLLAAVLSRSDRDLERDGVRLYAINTLGGVLGLGMTSLFLLPEFGGLGAMAATAGVNLMVAGVCLVLDRLAQTSSAVPRHSEQSPIKHRNLALALGVACFSGAGVLAFEVTSLQMTMLVAPLSFYAPTAILIVVVGLLAAGAGIVPLMTRWWGDAEELLPRVLAVTGLILALTPNLFLYIVRNVGGPTPMPVFAIWLFLLVLLVFFTLGPAVFLAALTFPLTLSWVSRDGGDSHGRRWGWLLAANGLGGLIGAELSYRWLLPAFGPYVSLGVIGTGYVIVGAVVAVGLGSASRQAFFLAIGAIGIISFTATQLTALPFLNPHLGFEVLEHRSGPEGTIAVVEKDGFGRALLMSNQYVLGGTAVRWDQERQTLLPLSLMPAAEKVCFIGLASGISAGAALERPSIKAVTAIELSPLVVELADKYFHDYNHGVVTDPRVTVAVDDGRVAVAAMPNEFDAIIGDLFLPWGPGEARLYSREHFMAAKAGLQPGGMFCQWLAMYQLTPEHFELIADTFSDVFGDVWLFQVGFDVQRPALALVGFRETNAGKESLQLGAPPVDHDWAVDPIIRDGPSTGLLYLGRYKSQRTPGNTLDNLAVELAAGRDRVTGSPGKKYYYGSRWADFVRESAGRIPPDDPRASFARIGALLTFWELREEMTPTARERLASRLRQQFSQLNLALPELDDERWPGDLSWLPRDS